MTPYRRYRRCVICGVRSGRINQEKRKFMARFPLDPNRCRQWVKIIGNKDLVYIPIEKLHQLKYVCGDHFRPKDFNRKKSRLKKWAVPSVAIHARPLTDDLLVELPYHIPISELTIASEVTEVQEDNEFMGDTISQINVDKAVPSTSGATLSADMNVHSVANYEVIDYTHHVAASVEIESEDNTTDMHVPSTSGTTITANMNDNSVTNYDVMDYSHHIAASVDVELEKDATDIHTPSMSGVITSTITSVHLPPEHVRLDHDYIRQSSEDVLPNIKATDRPKAAPSSSGVVGKLTKCIHTLPGHVRFDHDYYIKPTSEKLEEPTKEVLSRPKEDIELTPRKKKLLMKLEKNKITLKALQKKIKILDNIESPALKTLVMSTVKKSKTETSGQTME